jgi:16S rRNA (guanine966-N2)-methyltransferase
MRITGGIHRSRKLETPKNDAVRPTSDKVRQAVFNMLNSRSLIHDAHVLDAFCGTGALGLEALSQGAAHCVFFDNNKDSLYLCKSNIATLKEEPRTDILFQDAGKVRERPEKILPVNLVFLDPPYHKDLILKSIEALSQNNWFAPGAFFILEMAKDENIIPQFTQIENEKIYGDTKVLLASLKP